MFHQDGEEKCLVHSLTKFIFDESFHLFLLYFFMARIFIEYCIRLAIGMTSCFLYAQIFHKQFILNDRVPASTSTNDLQSCAKSLQKIIIKAPLDPLRTKEDWMRFFEQNVHQGLFDPLNLEKFYESASEIEKKNLDKTLGYLVNLVHKNQLTSKKASLVVSRIYQIVHRISWSNRYLEVGEEAVVSRVEQLVATHSVNDALTKLGIYKAPRKLHYAVEKLVSTKNSRVAELVILTAINIPSMLATNMPAVLPIYKPRFHADEISKLAQILSEKGTNAVRAELQKKYSTPLMAEVVSTRIRDLYAAVVLVVLTKQTVMDLQVQLKENQELAKRLQDETENLEIFPELDEKLKTLEISSEQDFKDIIISKTREDLKNRGMSKDEIDKQIQDLILAL